MVTSVSKAAKKHKNDPNKTPLRNARESRRLTVKEVADVVGTDQGALSRIERQKQVCNLTIAEALTKFFANEKLTENHILYPQRYMAKKAK